MLEENQTQPTEGTPKLSDYEIISDLKPVDTISREDAEKEYLKMLDNRESPIYDPRNRHYEGQLRRRDALLEKMYPPKTLEDRQREAAQIEKESQERKQNFEAEAAEKKRVEAERTLEMTWGKDWQKNVAQIHELVDDLGTVSLQDVQKIIASPQLGNDHEFIEALHIVTQKMRRAGFKGKRGR
jgi:hypothetical protein